MIVRQLTVLRCTKGLSQVEIAQKIGCSQDRISKFEASSDKDIRFGDLADYVIALGRGLRIIVTPEAAPPSPWKSKGKTDANCLPNRPSASTDPGRKKRSTPDHSDERSEKPYEGAVALFAIRRDAGVSHFFLLRSLPPFRSVYRRASAPSARWMTPRAPSPSPGKSPGPTGPTRTRR
jgi:transcriptional regulator with XRE-family HTH domain